MQQTSGVCSYFYQGILASTLLLESPEGPAAALVPAGGLVASLLFLSVPPLSVSLLFLPAGAVAMAFSVAALLILAVAVPLFVAATDTTRTRFQFVARSCGCCNQCFIFVLFKTCSTEYFCATGVLHGCVIRSGYCQYGDNDATANFSKWPLKVL